MNNSDAVNGKSEAVFCSDLVLKPVENEKSLFVMLRGSFSTESSSHEFEISSDGTGKIIYSDPVSDAEEFAHETNVAAVAAEIEELIKTEVESQNEQNQLQQSDIQAIREEITQAKLSEIFWDEVNELLEDSFLGFVYDDEWGEELRCECGSVEELTEFLELCLLTEREINDQSDYLVVEAGTETEEAGISTNGYWSERVSELVEIACRHFKPSGHRYDYNDGCYDRRSGYSLESESICVETINAINAPLRERMLGMKRLENILIELDLADEIIERLTNI